ncbi:MAG: HAD-IB family phosphatase [Candidatus Spechtbacterales bacterium]|nr:HAD-IB family phosphatase [Candidatus Spechtbacterales bacterium]
MRKNKKSVAVFDIDGTLFRSSLVIELVELLIEEGLFPESSRAVFQDEYDQWVDRKGTYNEYIMKVVEAFKNYIQGIKEEDVIRLSRDVLEQHKYKVYRYSRDLIDELKETHFLLTISHSPYYVVQPFAEFWGFDKAYAKLYSLDENKLFTGGIDGDELIMQKDKILERAIEKEGLTLEGSVGIGDTESDAAFLDMVERPIAFNPNSVLYEIARKNGWEVVVERKDVVYNIE